jgi:hypothetical protein
MIGNIHQDYTGTLTITADGKATISGIFTQDGAGEYKWTASNREKMILNPESTTQPISIIQPNIPNLRGIWDGVGNGYGGTINITTQNGIDFSGICFDTPLTIGKVSGTKVSFTRMIGNIRQDYTGTLTITADGKATISGTFTQDGAGEYKWMVTKQVNTK